jgi:hypothetical protein
MAGAAEHRRRRQREREMAERMGTASGAQNEGQSLGFERVVFFSDAVFAIVITLLVLPLTAELEVPRERADLIHEVFSGQALRMLTFAVGFLVVGQFWIAHHRMSGHLRRADHGLLWFNLVGLMTVAFMPFPPPSSAGRPWGQITSRWFLRGEHDCDECGVHRHMAVRGTERTGA